MKEYVTYGFNRNLFNPDRIEIHLEHGIQGKPDCAWWGSPVDAHYGWKEWCLGEDFHTESYFDERDKILWTFQPDTKIITIEDMGDLLSLRDRHLIYKKDNGDWDFDYKKILEKGYSAIELTDPNLGHYFFDIGDRLEKIMYCWDCESIVVLDKSKIKFLNLKEE